MKPKLRARIKEKKANTILRFPDLEHAKDAVLNSLNSAAGQRGYQYHGSEDDDAWAAACMGEKRSANNAGMTRREPRRTVRRDASIESSSKAG